MIVEHLWFDEGYIMLGFDNGYLVGGGAAPFFDST